MGRTQMERLLPECRDCLLGRSCRTVIGRGHRVCVAFVVDARLDIRELLLLVDRAGALGGFCGVPATLNRSSLHGTRLQRFQGNVVPCLTYPLQFFRRNVAAVLPQLCCNVATMVPQYCHLFAAICRCASAFATHCFPEHGTHVGNKRHRGGYFEHDGTIVPR